MVLALAVVRLVILPLHPTAMTPLVQLFCKLSHELSPGLFPELSHELSPRVPRVPRGC